MLQLGDNKSQTPPSLGTLRSSHPTPNVLGMMDGWCCHCFFFFFFFFFADLCQQMNYFWCWWVRCDRYFDGNSADGPVWQAGVPAVKDAIEAKILDLYITKYWAIKFSTAAACTVLRVDQVSLPGGLSSSVGFHSNLRRWSVVNRWRAWAGVSHGLVSTLPRLSWLFLTASESI